MVTNNNKKKVIFKKVSYIYFLFQFHKYKIKALFGIRTKINTINSNYTQKFNFIFHKTSIRVEKINGSAL